GLRELRANRRSASLRGRAFRESLKAKLGCRHASRERSVIASEAKQSRAGCTERAALDCFVAHAPRNDGYTVHLSPRAGRRDGHRRRGMWYCCKRAAKPAHWRPLDGIAF